jgi:hypothetical protein
MLWNFWRYRACHRLQSRVKETEGFHEAGDVCIARDDRLGYEHVWMAGSALMETQMERLKRIAGAPQLIRTDYRELSN